MTGPRLAVRAVIVRDDRVLLVNAYPDGESDMWCLPGGGVERHTSLPDNLRREMYEETGLTVTVGAPLALNEFHAPETGFHQVDVYFRCTLEETRIAPDWHDPDGVVTRHVWASREDLATLHHKPDSLADIAFGPPGRVLYDPLEILTK
ncbi:ADP-ribose pyrophosphatase YjhB, NUDIX family [Tranquillimonas rosea]|uniref:ADP-ribose pyrophosphatase YjhB, NUDIX family n=1 Tax=Tranquillimonas rosea TaxID=641238 RepID=A0A1H9RJD8_9RHOB|nr:NUDIX hydrolase [Tranquillimonas rosea]SER72814.1 ADP-ribose pyrophosphatase YjhB, NUDIX family [Tranquillimonas rosea]